MVQQVNVQPFIDAINAQPDPYPAVCSLVYLLLDRTHIDSEAKQDVLADISDIFDGIPPSPRAAFSGDLGSSKRKRRG